MFAYCRVAAQIRRVWRRDDPLQEPGARPGEGRAAVRGGAGAQTGGGDAPHLPGGTQAQVPAGAARHREQKTHRQLHVIFYNSLVYFFGRSCFTLTGRKLIKNNNLQSHAPRSCAWMRFQEAKTILGCDGRKQDDIVKIFALLSRMTSTSTKVKKHSNSNV